MADATTRFFESLGSRGHEPLLGRSTGSLRIDLHDGAKVEQWRVDLRRGAATVSRDPGPADCIIHTDAAFFDDLALGRANAMAAALRGQLALEGDPSLLVRFQRLFPAPTGKRVTSSARTVGKRRG
jgi:putative sterol carrier protein